MRVVSLACSNTEIVAALGRGDDLVGVDDHSDRPPELLAPLPRVGPDLEIDVAKVAALEPDLVLASDTVPGHERVIASLTEADLPVEVFAPERLDDVFVDIERIAALLGVSGRGAELTGAMRASLAPQPGTLRRPRIVVQWWNRPTIAPGRRSWVSDLIARAGGINPVDDDVRSKPLEDAELAALRPDAIVVSWCGVDPARYRPEVVLRNPALARTRAVRRGRVVPIPEAHLGRPGPGLVAGYRALVELVRTGGAPSAAR